MIDNPDKITITDIRLAGHCVSGTRDWFEKHNLDFRDMLRNGIDIEIFRALNDGFAQQVIERKEQRRGR